MATPGILLVTMTPRQDLAPAQFHEWYNNEHGPTRLQMTDIFTNGLRYKATSDDQPAFMAVYDIKAMSLLNEEKYTALRVNRSPREASVIHQVDVGRYFYDLVDVQESPTFVPVEGLTDDEARGMVTVIVEITLTDVHDARAEYQRWFQDEQINMVAKVPGWRRSRLFKTSVVVESARKDVCICLHDFSKQNGLGDAEHIKTMRASPGIDLPNRYIAAQSHQTWSLLYVFASGARDLASLSELPESATFASPDGRTVTVAGSEASISSCVTTKDDLIILYRLEGNPLSNSPVVAFSNSLLTSLYMWDAFVTILKSKRPEMRILRYDTRGRHAIPQPPVTATLNTVTDDLHAVLDALRIPRLHALIGASLGGATTLNFAIKYPSRLEKFIACDFNAASSPGNTQAWKDRIAVAEENAGRGIEKLASQTVERWFHPATIATKPDVAATMTRMVAENNVEGFKYSCTALWDYDLKPGLKNCRVAGLLVAGETDAKGAIVKAMDGFRELVGEKSLELKIVPRTGHLPMFEDAKAFWVAVEGFI